MRKLLLILFIFINAYSVAQKYEETPVVFEADSTRIEGDLSFKYDTIFANDRQDTLIISTVISDARDSIYVTSPDGTLDGWYGNGDTLANIINSSTLNDTLAYYVNGDTLQYYILASNLRDTIDIENERKVDIGGFEYSTIQSAIDAASTGEVINIYEGIYYIDSLAVKDSITLRGIGDVILKDTVSSPTNSGIIIGDSSHVWLENLTIQGKYLFNFEDSCNVNILNSTFESLPDDQANYISRFDIKDKAILKSVNTNYKYISTYNSVDATIANQADITIIGGEILVKEVLIRDSVTFDLAPEIVNNNNEINAFVIGRENSYNSEITGTVSTWKDTLSVGYDNWKASNDSCRIIGKITCQKFLDNIEINRGAEINIYNSKLEKVAISNNVKLFATNSSFERIGSTYGNTSIRLESVPFHFDGDLDYQIVNYSDIYDTLNWKPYTEGSHAIELSEFYNKNLYPSLFLNNVSIDYMGLDYFNSLPLTDQKVAFQINDYWYSSTLSTPITDSVSNGTDWATSTAYVNGDIVYYDDGISTRAWLCVNGHTSGTFQDDVDDNKFRLIVGGTLTTDGYLQAWQYIKSVGWRKKQRASIYRGGKYLNTGNPIALYHGDVYFDNVTINRYANWWRWKYGGNVDVSLLGRSVSYGYVQATGRARETVLNNVTLNNIGFDASPISGLNHVLDSNLNKVLKINDLKITGNDLSAGILFVISGQSIAPNDSNYVELNNYQFYSATDTTVSNIYYVSNDKSLAVNAVVTPDWYDLNTNYLTGLIKNRENQRIVLNKADIEELNIKNKSNTNPNGLYFNNDTARFSVPIQGASYVDRTGDCGGNTFDRNLMRYGISYPSPYQLAEGTITVEPGRSYILGSGTRFKDLHKFGSRIMFYDDNGIFRVYGVSSTPANDSLRTQSATKVSYSGSYYYGFPEGDANACAENRVKFIDNLVGDTIWVTCNFIRDINNTNLSFHTNLDLFLYADGNPNLNNKISLRIEKNFDQDNHLEVTNIYNPSNASYDIDEIAIGSYGDFTDKLVFFFIAPTNIAASSSYIQAYESYNLDNILINSVKPVSDNVVIDQIKRYLERGKIGSGLKIENDTLKKGNTTENTTDFMNGNTLLYFNGNGTNTGQFRIAPNSITQSVLDVATSQSAAFTVTNLLPTFTINKTAYPNRTINVNEGGIYLGGDYRSQFGSNHFITLGYFNDSVPNKQWETLEADTFKANYYEGVNNNGTNKQIPFVNITNDGYDHSASFTTDGTGGLISGNPTSTRTVITNGGLQNYISTTQRVGIAPSTADGASAVAHFFGTSNNYTTTGAKLLSIRNLASEKFFVDKDGSLFSYGDSIVLYNSNDTIKIITDATSTRIETQPTLGYYNKIEMEADGNMTIGSYNDATGEYGYINFDAINALVNIESSDGSNTTGFDIDAISDESIFYDNTRFKGDTLFNEGHEKIDSTLQIGCSSIVINRLYAHAYLPEDSTGVTSASAADTYYFVKGNFINDITRNMDFTGDTLQVDRSQIDSIYVRISYTVAVSANKNSTIRFGFSDDGNAWAGSTKSATLAIGETKSVTHSFNKWVEDNEKIKFVVKSSATSTNITISESDLELKELYTSENYNK